MVSFRLSGARSQTPIAGAPFHRWLSPDSRPWTLFYRTRDGYLLRFPGYADFEVSQDGEAVAGWGVDGVSDATIAHLYQNQVLPLALSQRGSMVLHGSAVEVEGAGIAFLGATGHGKSTLAAAFAQSGHPCLSDDGLVLAAEGQRYRIVPGPQSIRLWADSRSAMMGDDAPRAPPLEFTSKQRFLASDSLTFCATPLLLARIYLLSGEPAAEPLIDDIEPANALIGLVSNSFVLETEDRDTLAAHFEAVSELVERVPCHRLRYPRRYADLPRVRRAIVAHACVGRGVTEENREAGQQCGRTHR